MPLQLLFFNTSSIDRTTFLSSSLCKLGIQINGSIVCFPCRLCTDAGWGGVPALFSTCCAVCGHGHVPGGEGTSCHSGWENYGPTWGCWCSHFILTPSLTRMWFLTPSLNRCFGRWTISLAGLALWVCVVCAHLVNHKKFLSVSLHETLQCFCLEGVCLPGGDTDQLHRGYSLRGPTASGPQHLLPSLDCLARVLWTLEPRHDCFSLLQSRQDLPWAHPHGKTSTLFACCWLQITKLV